MPAQKHIQHFLETFNKDDAVQQRVLQMLVDTAQNNGELLEFMAALAEYKIDTKNLNIPAEETTEQPQEETAYFDHTGLKRNFTSADAEPADNEPADSLPADNEPDTKRICIEDESSAEGNGMFIPGISIGDGNIEDGPEIPYSMAETRKDNKSENAMDFSSKGTNSIENLQNGMTGYSNKEKNTTPFNKHVEPQDTESVFYKNIFVPATRQDPSGLSVPRDPSYLFPELQCKLCGLRYPRERTEEFGAHIEDHRRKARALNDKMVLRREFFTSKELKATVKLNLNANDLVEAIAWNKESPNCSVCGRPIKKIWKDEVESWVLDNGTRVNEDEYAHRECVL